MQKILLLLLIPLALAACATTISDKQAAYAVERYGPECGVNADLMRAPASDPRVRAAGQCIGERLRAEQRQSNTPSLADSFLQGLGQGFRNAGAVMSSDVYNAQQGLPPTPAPKQTDFKCMNDCTMRGYAYPLCQARCSY